MIRSALHNAAVLATRGVPAVRAAVYGARIGAGAAFSTAASARAKLATLGIGVSGAAPGVALPPVEAALTAGAGGVIPVLKVTAVSKAGVSLRATPLGIGATVSEELVATAARSTVRGALSAVGRATAVGAAGGAVVDAAMTAIALVPSLRAGRLSPKGAATEIGISAARGALSGAAGVAAAGVVSAGIAATGLTIAGAPVVVPLVTMVAASALVARAFDRRFGRSLPAPAASTAS